MSSNVRYPSPNGTVDCLVTSLIYCRLEVGGSPASLNVFRQRTIEAHDDFHHWLGKALAG